MTRPCTECGRPTVSFQFPVQCETCAAGLELLEMTGQEETELEDEEDEA